MLLGTSVTNAQNTGRIEGVAVSSSGVPVGDAEIRIVGLARLVDADDQGAFVFEDVPAGDYIVAVRSAQWGQGYVRAAVIAGGSTTITARILHHVHLGEVIVTAGPVAHLRHDAVLPMDVVGIEDMLSAGGVSLGEVVGDRPGVSSTYFGPGASRPLIRGLGGNRVTVMQQGIAIADVSDYSPDHAVSVEPLTSDRIEIIRGPGTLLYGSSAMGGVLNVLDGRVPNELPTQSITGSVTVRGGSAARERTGAVNLQGAGGNHIAWHVSGLRRQTNDFSIPGFAEVHEDDEHDEEEEHEEEHEHDEEEEEAVAGVLENSAVLTGSASIGASFIGSNGYIGAAYTYYDSRYGVPGHAHGEHHEEEEEHEEEEHEHEEEEESGTEVDMIQKSFDIEGSWRFKSTIIRGLRVRFGASNYTHDEIEGDHVGVTFDNEQIEGRLELDHSITAHNHGVIGIQVKNRDLSMIGEEAFIPETATDKLAVFALERFEIGSVILETGARYEMANLTPASDARDREFSGASLSAGVNYGPTDQWSLALSAARSVKIPDASELYSNGPHVATRSFEIGDENLESETALSLDISMHVHFPRVQATFSVFDNRFKDFIYLRNTAEVEDGFAVFYVSQSDATFRGFETELDVELFSGDNRHVWARLWSDRTRAELSDGTPLPRIPPFRFGGGLRFVDGQLEVKASFTNAAAQDRIPRYEHETEGYTALDASVSWTFVAAQTAHAVTLSGGNLTDAEIRRHTSFLKDLAPLPGRDIRLSYQFIF